MTLSRERIALTQLSAVGQARFYRLENERQALAERERLLLQAMESQALDEALLAQQRAQWAAAWQDQVSAGGAVRDALALGSDRALLKEMATLLAGRHSELQRQADTLRADRSAWLTRWRAAQALDESLQDRTRTVNRSLERAAERTRDEEALMVRVAAVPGASHMFSNSLGETGS
jgi:hypothetical protein